MNLYYMNEASFDLPEAHFIDRTVTLLEALTPRGATVTLLVQRLPIPLGQSLRDVVSAHLTRAAGTQRAFTVLSQQDIDLGGAPAIAVTARWRDEQGMVFRREAHFALGPRWLFIAAHARFEEQEQVNQHFDQLLGSIRMRD
jgi:hypothetical protein